MIDNISLFFPQRFLSASSHVRYDSFAIYAIAKGGEEPNFRSQFGLTHDISIPASSPPFAPVSVGSAVFDNVLQLGDPHVSSSA